MQEEAIASRTKLKRQNVDDDISSPAADDCDKFINISDMQLLEQN